MMPSKLDRDPDLARQLVEEYRQDVQARALACRYSVGWAALRRTIQAHGVEIRPPANTLHTYPSGKRSKRRPLTDEQVEQLRRMIGYSPDWPDD